MKWTQIMDLNKYPHIKFADGAFKGELNKVVPFRFGYNGKKIGTSKLIKEDKGKLTIEIDCDNEEFFMKACNLAFEPHATFESINYGKQIKIKEVIPASIGLQQYVEAARRGCGSCGDVKK